MHFWINFLTLFMQRCIYRVYTIHVQFPCASKICGILSVWYNNCKYDVYTVYIHWLYIRRWNRCASQIYGILSVWYKTCKYYVYTMYIQCIYNMLLTVYTVYIQWLYTNCIFTVYTVTVYTKTLWCWKASNCMKTVYLIYIHHCIYSVYTSYIFCIYSVSCQDPPRVFVNGTLQQPKGAFLINPVSPRSKIRRFFDFWHRHGAIMKKAPFRRQKSIFRIFLIFTKNKGALN